MCPCVSGSIENEVQWIGARAAAFLYHRADVQYGLGLARVGRCAKRDRRDGGRKGENRLHLIPVVPKRALVIHWLERCWSV